MGNIDPDDLGGYVSAATFDHVLLVSFCAFAIGWFYERTVSMAEAEPPEPWLVGFKVFMFGAPLLAFAVPAQAVAHSSPAGHALLFVSTGIGVFVVHRLRDGQSKLLFLSIPVIGLVCLGGWAIATWILACLLLGSVGIKKPSLPEVPRGEPSEKTYEKPQALGEKQVPDILPRDIPEAVQVQAIAPERIAKPINSRFMKFDRGHRLVFSPPEEIDQKRRSRNRGVAALAILAVGAATWWVFSLL